MPFVKIQGGELFYEEMGKGPAVVFVHGTTGNSDHWANQMAAFAKAGYRAVRFDLRGYGRSKVDQSQETVGTIADDIELIRTALKLGRIFVVGQSNGAEGAIDYGLDFPRTTRALVACTSWRTADSEPEHLALRDKLVPMALRQRSRVELQLSARYRAANPEGERAFWAIDKANNRPTPIPGQGVGQERRAPSTYARLAQMTVPTLVVAADEDILTPVPLMKDLADHIRGARMAIIPQAGRYSFWEQPQAFNAAVLAFFAEIDGRRAVLAPEIRTRRGFAQAAGARLYVEDAGSSHRAVVFVHDDGDDGGRFEARIPAFLAAGYRCIRFDRRGCGRSGAGAGGSPVQDMEGVADALGLGSFYLVAEGGGAAEALAFSRERPQRLRGLALLDAPVSPGAGRTGTAPALALSGAEGDWSPAVIAFLDRQA